MTDEIIQSEIGEKIMTQFGEMIFYLKPLKSAILLHTKTHDHELCNLHNKICDAMSDFCNYMYNHCGDEGETND